MDLALLDRSPTIRWVVDTVVPEASAGLLYGEPEAGKTWVYLSCVAELIGSGTGVIIIDEQNRPEDVLRRLVRSAFPRLPSSSSTTTATPRSHGRTPRAWQRPCAQAALASLSTTPWLKPVHCRRQRERR
jgi:hypothetical protein